MPKITEYGASKVETQVTQGARARSYRVAGIGDLAPVVDSIGQMYQEQQNRADKTAAEEALINFEREKNNLFFDPNTGYFNKQGRDAYDGAKGISDSLAELKKKYSKGLSERAQIAYSKAADTTINRSNADIMRHASKQNLAWEVSTIQARVENTLENSQLYWNDEERLQVQNALGRQSIIDAGKLEGAGPETVNERLQTYDSSFAKGVILAATQKSSVEGKQLLDKYESMLEGPDRIKISSVIEAKQKEEKSKYDAAYAVMTASSLLTKYDSKGDAMVDPVVESLKEKDPQLYKSVRSEISAQFNAKDAKTAADEKDAYYRVIDMVNDGASLAEMKQSDDWLKMNGYQRNNILSGKHVISDYVKLNELLSLPTKELARVDPNKYVGDLNKTDFNKLTSNIDKAKKGQSLTRVESLSTKSMRVAQEIFGDKKKWRKRAGGLTDKGQLANDFLKYLQDTVQDFEEEKDRKITPEEEDKLIANMTRGFYVQRSAFGFDFLAPDVDLNIKNTPVKDLNMLNRISDHFGMSASDKTKLARAYEALIDAELEITPENLQQEFNKQ